ncbi:hypothetical protein HY004_02795 [Candidatus Saccharibacteria bacterium]|nr:hypothetical protein [Candidatus Saccharibacteria bacterium]
MPSTTAAAQEKGEFSVPEEWALTGRITDEAQHLASDLRKHRSIRYNEQLSTSAPMSLRVPERTRKLIKELSASSHIKRSYIREMIAAATEEELGKNSQITHGRWWITVKRF